MRLLFLVTGVLLLPFVSFSQNRIQIQNTDLLKGERGDQGFVRRLIGNVRLKDGELFFSCDSAYHYVDLKRIDGFGNVKIRDDDQEVYARRVSYNLETEIAEFENQVVIITESTVLQSVSGRYFYPTKTASFPDGVFLEDEQGIVVADKGFFYTEVDSAVLWENVMIQDSLRYLKADSMLINRSSDEYEAFGNVLVLSDEQVLTADYSYADSTGYRSAVGSVIVQDIDSTSSDTTQIRCEIFEVIERDSVKSITTEKQVRIWNPSYQALADSVHYSDSTETFRFRKDPILWYQNLQVVADFADLKLEEEQPKYLNTWPLSTVVELDSISGRFNQINGDSLNLWFVDGRADFMHINGSTDLIYQTRNDQDQADGAIKMNSIGLSLNFDEEGISQVKGERQISGSVFEESEMLITLKLSRFFWNPDVRPVKYFAFPTDSLIDLETLNPGHTLIWGLKR